MVRGPVKVYIVDDSAVSRVALRRILSGDPQISIVGEAASGREALAMIPQLGPDLVLMDIFMPGINGLETTRRLLRSYPRPVLIISDQVGGNADLSFEALQAGALEVIGKPSASELASPVWTGALQRKIKLLAEVPVITRHRRRVSQPVPESTTPAPTPVRVPRPQPARRPPAEQIDLVCIGASTGGPPALLQILKQLGTARWPVVIVQHMAPGFVGGMVEWLRDATGQEIVIARDGEPMRSGVVYVAGDGSHLELDNWFFKYTQNPPMRGHRPAVDAMLTSVAAGVSADKTLAVLLTGMGRDGAAGLKRLREAGAWTIAQDEASSVVYGMPKAAVELKAACEELSLEQITSCLAALSW